MRRPTLYRFVRKEKGDSRSRAQHPRFSSEGRVWRRAAIVVVVVVGGASALIKGGVCAYVCVYREYTPYAFTSVYMKPVPGGGACVQAWLNSAVSTVARTGIQLIPGGPDIYLLLHTTSTGQTQALRY